jgi:DNA modification methylase
MKLITGDCIEAMAKLDDNSVDAIVTDPPYEIGFMGKGWDNSGIAYSLNMWGQCFRVLKPGGYLLSFGGSRTYHRMAVAIEDSGFEIRDMIEWVYGSGFPKSLNIGKAVDKENGWKGGQEWVEETKGTSEWEGWGTALKPAHEPICMARKPLAEKTVAENVLKYGTGGINIDGSRVETTEDLTINGNRNNVKSHWGNSEGESKVEASPLGRFPANLIHDNSEEVRECFPDSKSAGEYKKEKLNTFKPDKAMFALGYQTNAYAGETGNASRFFKSIIYQAKASKKERDRGLESFPISRPDTRTSSGMGTFEQKRVLPGRNNHPTVKPIALMEYLINMVTREGQTVLDPFMGSGTTGIACKKLGRDFIGIDLTKDYVNIAKARIASVKGGK